MAGLFALVSVAAAQTAPTNIPAVADPKFGVFIERMPRDRSPEADFVYEAARSRSFGIVERETQYGVNRYAAVEDEARCVELIKNAHGPGKVASLGWAYRYTPFPREPYDSDAVRGICVSVEKIAAPSARYVVTQDGLRDSTSGQFILPPGTFTSSEQIWSAFGLPRFNPTVWKGGWRESDPSDDRDLVRALTSDDPTTRAAVLNLLNRRVVFANFSNVKRTALRQPTGALVAAALLATGFATAPESERRRAGAFAAAAIPAGADVLFPALMQALDEPVNPLSDDEAKKRELLEKRAPGLGNFVTGSPEPRPGFAIGILFDTAAMAASVYGPSYASAFVKKYDDHLGKILRQEIFGVYPIGGYIMVVAAAPEASGVILRLFADADSPGAKNKNGTLENAAAVIASVRVIPPDVVPALRKRCAGAGAETRPFTTLFCDVQLARTGDAEAFQRLMAILRAPPDGADHARFNAARQMLFFLGPKGVTGLKDAAMAAPPGAAKPILQALCELGTEAGPEIVARAKAEAESMPADSILKSMAARCAQRGPVGAFGEFITLWNAN
ncbi:MAG: hypothetical protein AB7T40_03410 [Alphaproteobacteria bacterium]